MTVEFEHRNVFGRVLGRERLFSQTDVVLDGRVTSIHGIFSVAPSGAIHVESDEAVSFCDWSKGRIPYMWTSLSGELRGREINAANSRTRRDRRGRYSTVRWRPTTGTDMGEELDRFGRYLPDTQSDLVHGITRETRRRLATQPEPPYILKYY